MAEIGSAYLTIVPRFRNLSGTIDSALSAVDATGSGKKVGSRFSLGVQRGVSGLGSSGAVIGAFSSITSSAMSAVAGSVSAAASRLDTLKNYPAVMQSLGYSSADAEASIQTMSDRLQGLPTSLDSMASVVSGITAVTGDLGKATKVGLAFNDMMLASGSNTQLVSAATEQFRQILAKGTPQLQDWRSIVDAAPGQMDQLAKSMLGPTANANDLYEALGGGGADATLSMDDLMDAIVRLDTEGSAGMASFESQARTSSQGIQTSAENIKTALVRGMADVMDSVGRDTISGALNDVRDLVSSTFGTVSKAAAAASPAVKAVVDDLNALAPAGVAAVGAFAGFRAASAGVSALSGVASGLSGTAAKAATGLEKLSYAAKSEKIMNMSIAASSLSSTLAGPWGIAVAAAGVGVSFLVAKAIEMKQASDAEEKATRGVSSAVSAMAAAASDGAGTVDVAGSTMEAAYKRAASSAEAAKQAHEQFVKTGGETADAIGGIASSLSQQNSALEAAAATIEAYSGKSHLTAAQQQQLKDAVDTVNSSCGSSITLEDALAGKYSDEAGNVHDLVEETWNLVKARQAQNDAQAYLDTASQLGTAAAAARNDMQAQMSAASDSSAAFFEQMDEMGLSSVAQAKGNIELVRQALASGNLEAIDGITDEDKELSNLYAQWQKQGQAYRQASDQLHQLTDDQADYSYAAQSASALSAVGYDKAQLSLQQLAGASQEALAAFAGDGEKAGLSLQSFSDALAAASADDDALRDRLANDPDAMAKLVAAYDGTAGSLEGALSDLGVGFDSVAAEANDAQANMHQFLDSLGDDAMASLAAAGTSIDGLEAALTDAGVSTQELADMGSENFGRLVESCEGDSGRIAEAMRAVNALQLDPKTITVNDDGTIETASGKVLDLDAQTIDGKSFTVSDDGTIRDEQGSIIALDSMDLVEKHLSVTDDGTIVDQEGRVWDLDAQTIGTKHFDVNDDGTIVTEEGEVINLDEYMIGDKPFSVWANNIAQANQAVDSVDSNNVGDKDFDVNAHDHASGVIEGIKSALSGIGDVFFNVSANGNAAGGIRTHADGGVRYHAAGGAIATRAVPLDIVGEAGAEAIVPLTNRAYSQPFADIIADEVARRGGLHPSAVNNYYIEGTVFNDQDVMAMTVYEALGKVARRAAMDRG